MYAVYNLRFLTDEYSNYNYQYCYFNGKWILSFCKKNLLKKDYNSSCKIVDYQVIYTLFCLKEVIDYAYIDTYDLNKMYGNLCIIFKIGLFLKVKEKIKRLFSACVKKY